MNAKRDTHRLSASMSVDIQQTSKTDWRISAPASDTEPASRILGFVEQLEPHRFEILWMSEPMGWGYADNLGSAIEAVAGGRRNSDEVSPERDETLRHPELRFSAATFTAPPAAVRSHHRETWVTHGGAHVA